MFKIIEERFLENILSVKVWCIFIATGLLCFGFLTGMEYSIVISTILAAREAFKVSKIKWGNSEDKPKHI
jgi:hypothetical protein